MPQRPAHPATLRRRTRRNERLDQLESRSGISRALSHRRTITESKKEITYQHRGLCGQVPIPRGIAQTPWVRWSGGPVGAVDGEGRRFAARRQVAGRFVGYPMETAPIGVRSCPVRRTSRHAGKRSTGRPKKQTDQRRPRPAGPTTRKVRFGVLEMGGPVRVNDDQQCCLDRGREPPVSRQRGVLANIVRIVEGRVVQVLDEND
jgi:hypothetical protein